MSIRNILTIIVLGSVSLVGCATEGEEYTDESVAQADQAVFSGGTNYGHLWDVYREVNYVRESTPLVAGTTRPMTEQQMVLAWQLPYSIWDSGVTPSANSGYVCVTMQPNGNPYCLNLRNFECDNSSGSCMPISIEASPEEGIPTGFYIRKRLNSGNWQAWRGANGQNWQWSYNAKYGIGDQ
ncbi:MAG: hypothetical protein QM784_39095 [Polyangiaceae bacterium]